MSVTLDLDPQTEARLAGAAASEGVAPEAFIRRMIDTQFDPALDAGLTPEEQLARMKARLRKWAAADERPHLPPGERLPGETADDAFFRRGREEATRMSPEEMEAEVALFEDIQRSLTADRGLRLRF